MQDPRAPGQEAKMPETVEFTPEVAEATESI